MIFHRMNTIHEKHAKKEKNYYHFQIVYINCKFCSAFSHLYLLCVCWVDWKWCRDIVLSLNYWIGSMDSIQKKLKVRHFLFIEIFLLDFSLLHFFQFIYENYLKTLMNASISTEFIFVWFLRASMHLNVWRTTKNME